MWFVDVAVGALSASSTQVATHDEQVDDYDHNCISAECGMYEDIEVLYQEMEDSDHANEEQKTFSAVSKGSYVDVWLDNSRFIEADEEYESEDVVDGRKE
jgi:hypothetical protein